MKTILKIAVGIILAVVVLIAACAALVSSGVQEAQNESDRTAITPEQYREVGRGTTRDELVEDFGEPQSQQQVDQDLPQEARDAVPEGEEDLECVYYGRRGQLAKLYQFCFDGNGRFESKSSF